jgi:hypothetical protein
MAQRVDLQNLLEFLAGHRRVYFQSPGAERMAYPAIVYTRDGRVNQFADNAPYATKKRYQVTIIDPIADSELVDKIAALPLCTFVRYFETEGLHHDIYSLYF